MDAVATWDVVLLVVATGIAIIALVRLMAMHRDRLIADVRRQLHEEQHRRSANGE